LLLNQEPSDYSAGNRPAQKRQLKIAHLFAQLCYGAAAVSTFAVFVIILGNEILKSGVHVAPGMCEVVVEDSLVEILLRG